MMRKFFYFLLLLNLCLPAALSQENMKSGISAIGGFNLFNLNVHYQESTSLPRYGVALGLSGGIGAGFHLFKRLSLEADVLYKFKNSELVEFSGMEWGDVFYQFQYLALPLLFRFRFLFSPVQIAATLGFETDILLRARWKDKKRDISGWLQDFRSLDYQWIGGIGVRYKSLNLDLRYGLGVSNMHKKSEKSLAIKNRDLEFLLSYRFLSF